MATSDDTIDVDDRVEGAASSGRAAFVVLCVSVLALVAVALPLWTAAHYGALGHPRSDDWSYLRTLFGVAEGRGWDFNGWVSMTLVGQVVATLPAAKLFPGSIEAARVTSALLGLCGLLAVVALARAVRIPRPAALLCAVTIAIGPLWGPLASTYMTDVPSFALQAITLLFGALSLRRPAPQGAFAAAIVAGVAAVSVRQYAAVVVIAILLAHAWTNWRRGDRAALRTTIVGAIAAFAAIGALLAWWSTIPGSLVFAPKIPNGQTVRIAFESAGGFARLAGLLLVPLLVYVGPASIVRRARAADEQTTRVIAVLTAAVLALSWLSNSTAPFVGNYVDRRGVLADDIVHGTRPDLMPSFLFLLTVVVGSIGALLLVLAAVPWFVRHRPALRDRRLPGPDPVGALLALTVFGTFVAHELTILVDEPVFDRYVLAALPSIGVMLLRSTVGAADAAAPAAVSGAPMQASHRTIATTVALLVLAAVGVVYSAESASYDGARWKVAELAVRAGYPVADVDGGYEWVGFRLHRAPPYRLIGKPEQYRRSVKERYVRGLCVQVVVNPPGRPDRAIAHTTSTGLLRETVDLYAVRTNRPCARPPAADAPER